MAVTNGDKLLMTKYADRSLSQWVLISGFVEIGETLEEAVKREVFEKRVSASRIYSILEASPGVFPIPLSWVIPPNWMDRMKFILIPGSWQWRHGIPVLIYQKS